MIRRTGDRARGRRNPIELTDRGRRTRDAIWQTAQTTNNLCDAGLTRHESSELNRLLLRVVRATQGNPAAGNEQRWTLEH